MEAVTTDVVELCTLLQCLGFSVKSLDTSDGNISQDGGARTVVINCQSSGIHVVLETAALSCSCPVSEQNSGFWQVQGMAGGKQLEKECGSTILPTIAKSHRDRITRELQLMLRDIRTLSDEPKPINRSASMVEMANQSGSQVELAKENKSASMLEMATPEKRTLAIKAETPSRYRSLDALTTDTLNPQIRLLQEQFAMPHSDTKTNLSRQSTYTIRSTPGSARRRNKTSSPIQGPQNTILESLLEAESAAESLRNKLSIVIREVMEEDKNDDSSISSMLDVSKISVLKATETSKAQFASSPNLSGIGVLKEELPKSRLKRLDSASTSSLISRPTPEGFKSKLKRISPSIFRSKKDSSQDEKKKSHGLFKTKIVVPVRREIPPASPSFSSSASKKKFSHVKSTIPRPTPKKE